MKDLQAYHGNKFRVDNERDKFINNIALRSAINAAVQTRSHNHPVFSRLVVIDRRDSREEQVLKYNRKLQVTSFWKDKLQAHAMAYCIEQRDAAFFVQGVHNLQEEINGEYRHLFAGDTIRIAQCQKSLAVYLKWLWCWGKCPLEPPVCPIDRQVLNHCYRNELQKHSEEDNNWRRLIARIKNEGGWGQLNRMEDYEALVNMTITVAGRHEERVASWELRVFNDVVLDDINE